jgi:hypothetical protein
MLISLHEPGDEMASRFWRNEAYLRREFSRIGTAALRGERLDGPSRLEALLAKELARCDELRTARTNIAASAALLPITPDMAWAVPQLLKRIGLVSPGVLSTSGALRSLIQMPERDEQFAKAFTDSGFLSCDRAIERERWKYDIIEMMAKQHAGSAWQILEHCRVLLTQHRTKQPLDWDDVLMELQTLISWFPELRTIRLLEQLYARLYALHVKSVLAVQCWLDWRAGTTEAIPDSSAYAPSAAMAFAF